MKESQYNKIIKFKNNYIFYNMISKSIIISESPSFNSSQYDLLVKNGFYIENNYNELDIAKYNYWQSCWDNRYLSLTLVPTMSCNLKCSYCYQEHSNKIVSLNEKIINGIISEVNKNINLKRLHIEWFGGEPTLLIDDIVNATLHIDKACKEKGIKFDVAINSNLYTYNLEIENKLLKSKIFDITTTLCGTKKEHDKYRLNINNCPTFKQTFDNICKASKKFNVLININITIDTDFTVLCKLLNQIKNNCPNVSVLFSRIENIGICELPFFMDIEKYRKLYIEIANYAMDIGITVALTSNFTGKCLYCGSQHFYSFSIDENCNLYKCVDNFREEDIIGKVLDEGFIYKKNISFNYKDVYNDSICSICELLPYCNGGCSYKKKNNMAYCPDDKYYFDDLLKLFTKQALNQKK